MSAPKLVNVPLAVPEPLKAWIRAEAAAHGMSVNAFLNFQLRLCQQTAVVERLRRVESRVAELERKLSPGAQ